MPYHKMSGRECHWIVIDTLDIIRSFAFLGIHDKKRRFFHPGVRIYGALMIVLQSPMPSGISGKK